MLKSTNRPEHEPHTFSLAGAILALAILEGLVFAQALVAYLDGFLSVSQMRARGVDYGLPFLWHLGMWGDIFNISPLCAFLVGRYSNQWRLLDAVSSAILAFIIAAIMSWTYTFSEYPEAHVQDHRLTQAGLIHLAYMTASIAILIHFFFRTRDIRSTPMVIASTLVIVHLLLGTHMILGLMAEYVPLVWYPGKPLRSIGGWTIIGTVSLIVITRSLAACGFLTGLERNVDAALSTRYAKFGIMFGIKFVMVQDPDDIEGYIKLLDRLCVVVGVGLFVSAGLKFLEQGAAGYGTGFLVLLIGYVFLASRHSVKTELTIARKLFPPERIPKGWGTRKDWLVNTLLIIGFMALYAAVALFADNLVIVTLCMALIACNDFRTRLKIGEAVADLFGDRRYAPDPQNVGYRVIRARRKIVWQYLVRKPHRIKEGAKVIGSTGAYVLAMLGYLYSDARLTSAAYWLLILTLALNEIVGLVWRLQRHYKIEVIPDRLAHGPKTQAG